MSIDLSGIFFIEQDILRNALTKTKDDDLIQKISTIQSSLDKAHISLGSANASLTDTVQNQGQMQNIVNSEKQMLLDKKNRIDTSISSKNRMLQLNESARERTAAYNQLLLLIVIGLFIFTAIMILSRMFPFVPEPVYDILAIISACYFIFAVSFKYIEIYRRDELYYDELKLAQPDVLTPDQLAATKQVENSTNLLSGINLGTCIGSKCCADDTVWDSAKSVCTKPTLSYTPTTSSPTSSSMGSRVIRRIRIPISSPASFVTTASPSVQSFTNKNVSPNSPSEFDNYAII